MSKVKGICIPDIKVKDNEHMSICEFYLVKVRGMVKLAIQPNHESDILLFGEDKEITWTTREDIKLIKMVTDKVVINVEE